MPNNYVGDSTAANFGAAVAITLDGEPFQYGDASSGYFGVTKALLDRVAWLKAHGLDIAAGPGSQAIAGVGDILFEGSGATIVFASTLGVVEINCAAQLGGSATFTIQNGSTVEFANGATLKLDASSIVVDNGNRTIKGIYTLDNSLGNGIINAGTGCQIHASAGGDIGVHVGATFNMNGQAFFDGTDPSASVTVRNGMQVAFADTTQLNLGANTTINASGQTNQLGPTNYVGNNAYAGKRIIRIPPSTATVIAHHCDVLALNAALTSNIVLTLADVPGNLGHQVKFFFVGPFGGSNVNTITFRDSGGVLIGIISAASWPGFTTGSVGTIEFMYDNLSSPKWDVIACGSVL